MTMKGEHWVCQSCNHEVYDTEGETGQVNGVIERNGELFADDPCVVCGGELKREEI